MRKPWLSLVGLVVAVPLVVGLLATMFTWPAASSAPRDVPIGVAADGRLPSALADTITGTVRDRLRDVESEPGEQDAAFDVRTYDDRAQAVEAIRDREVYGALVLGPEGGTLYTASAASPAVAQLLTQASAGIGERLAAMLPTAAANEAMPEADAATGIEVRDVVSTTEDDPQGRVFASTVMPLTFAGMFTGILLSQVRVSGWARIAALLVAAAGSGMVANLVAQTWLGALDGDWWRNAGAFGFTILGIGAGVAGLGAVFGQVGTALGAASMMLLGNPLSGIATAPEMLPSWAGTLGQLFPLGAGGNLVRATAFFDGAGSSGPLVVLAVWSFVGLLLVLVGWYVQRDSAKGVERDSASDELSATLPTGDGTAFTS